MSKNKKIIDLGERGKYNSANKLNDLTGKEWIKFSKSWFVLRPPKRKKDVKLHPAKFPEQLAADFISFFTKQNDWVLDPFMGTASTLISAGELKRNCVGIELNKKYYQTSKRRVGQKNFSDNVLPLHGDSHYLKELLAENELAGIRFDYTFTSPPYWNQLERDSMRQKRRKESGFDTKYSKMNERDLGNIRSYSEFLEVQAKIFDEVYDVTKKNGYLTIVTNNIYHDGKLYPLAFDTAVTLTQRGNKSWVLKDEKIWLQDDKGLIALGVNHAWVGNRHHHYCLIFRKEYE